MLLSPALRGQPPTPIRVSHQSSCNPRLGAVSLGASGTYYVPYDGSSITDTVRFVVTDNVGWTQTWEFRHCYVNPSQPGVGRPTVPGVIVTPTIEQHVVAQGISDGAARRRGNVLGHDSLTRYYIPGYRQTTLGDWIEVESCIALRAKPSRRAAIGPAPIAC